MKRAPLGTEDGERWLREWRFAALGGCSAGLALAQLVAPDPSLRALGAAPIAVIGLVAARPREGEAAAFAWLVVVGLVAALGGLLAGGARVHSIDDGALLTHPGQPATVDGFVAGVPRRNGGEVDVRVDSAGGRVLVVAPEPVGDLPVGSEVRAEGALETPEPWRAGYLRRQGIAMTLRTDRIDRAARAPRRVRRMDRRNQGACRGGAGARHARARGGTGARLRPRRGRPDRPRDARGLPALEPDPPAGRQRRERDPALRPGLAAAGAARAAATRPADRGALPDRDLRAGHGGRPIDSACRGDGGRRPDRRPGRPAALALVRRAARRGDHARHQSARGRRRRLAAQLRGGDRDHALVEAPCPADLGVARARIGPRRPGGGGCGHRRRRRWRLRR